MVRKFYENIICEIKKREKTFIAIQMLEKELSNCDNKSIINSSLVSITQHLMIFIRGKDKTLADGNVL